MTFFESLEEQARSKGGPVCVGIDPRTEPGPDSFRNLTDYGCRIVDACAPWAAAFKPQLAFFERHGAAGLDALNAILEHIRSVDPDFPVILDAKRGDIGSTAEAYAQALLDRPGNLAVTLSPYLGKESVQPFLNRSGKGMFVLCRTTNPGAGKLQQQRLENGLPLYLAFADEIMSWDPDPGTPSVGLVVAGNDSEVLASVRSRHPDAWFLAPGIGAQGGRPEKALAAGSRSDGFGILVSASRSVADAPDPGLAARELKEALDSARKKPTEPAVFGGFSTPGSLSDSERREFLEGLFRIGAFQTGEFILKSGQKSPFYIDLRRISADPRILTLAGRAYAGMLNGIQAQHIAGIPVAALPLAAAASLESGRGLIYPRLEQKKHGSGARVEGVWQSGETAVMLDDLITTGGSKREAAAVLRDAGLIVTDLVVLIERGAQGRRDMEAAGIRLHSWAGIEDLLKAGQDAGFIDCEKAREVREYAAG